MKYICQICDDVYDEAIEKVPFNELPDTWRCPLCGAEKSAFAPEAVKSEAVSAPVVSTVLQTDNQKKLSVGQLAALCSNLSRGCEKQYKAEESDLFQELADYFTSITPPINDPSVETLAKDLQEDIDNYANVRFVADKNKDRGTARICVWGEKVTRILCSLVNRYLKDGETMLADTNIWICTTCGFVYVGDDAPELCPVCKVPAWKFEKIEGRTSS